MPKVEAAADAEALVSMRDDMLHAIDNWRNKELLRLAEHQGSPSPAV
ncbi:hypothetical protein KYC5002_40010 [Archangium violaceum]|nr:hypothetical protein KYC5002_40010 [Archangium gephyra]